MTATLLGRAPDGHDIDAHTLGAGGPLIATVMTYGARLAALHWMARDGVRDVILPLPTLAVALADTAFRGAVVGRVGNRIDGGRFTLDAHAYELATNDGTNTLHGGPVGFDRAVWHAESDGDNGLRLTHDSADGDQGFPGRLHATVHYAVEGADLVIDYLATADAPTIVNLTNHAYFNLGAPDILGHTVMIAADRITAVRDDMIPTGELMPVENTPFDFRSPHPIGARIGATHPQLKPGDGYDHNFVLADAPRPEPEIAAEVAAAGVRMTVLTTEPGIQFYSGNMMAKSGLPYRGALCLETQTWPDAPNHPNFPTMTLRPGQMRRSRTILRFTNL